MIDPTPEGPDVRPNEADRRFVEWLADWCNARLVERGVKDNPFAAAHRTWGEDGEVLLRLAAHRIASEQAAVKRATGELRKEIERLQRVLREDNISARIIEVENNGRNYAVGRDARFIRERTEAVLSGVNLQEDPATADLRRQNDAMRKALEYYEGAPWVENKTGVWYNSNYADVAKKALAAGKERT